MEDILALFDLIPKGIGFFLLIASMEDGPFLKRELLVHFSLNVLVELLLTHMSLETL